MDRDGVAHRRRRAPWLALVCVGALGLACRGDDPGAGEQGSSTETETGDGDGDGDGDPPMTNDPTQFECATTEPLTLGEVYVNDLAKVIHAPVEEINAVLTLDFWVDELGMYDLSDTLQISTYDCTHCVFMQGPAGQWWAVEGTLTVDDYFDYHLNSGSITGLRLQETIIDWDTLTQTFIGEPRCYTIEEFSWDTMPGNGN